MGTIAVFEMYGTISEIETTHYENTPIQIY